MTDLNLGSFRAELADAESALAYCDSDIAPDFAPFPWAPLDPAASSIA